MIRKNAEYPYNEYWLYIVFHKKEKRSYAVLVNKVDQKVRTCISYARYLMSVSEKRVLEDYEQVDHKNEIKQDDRIENLQILSDKENRDKHIKDTLLKYKMVILRCPNPKCNKIFEKMINKTHLSKGGTYTCCSRKCQYEINKIFSSIDFSNNVIEIQERNTYERLCIK